ncbi:MULTISPECIES: hypothetical protein, partial [Eubacteriales]|uniref:hypothetical protein n=1 Tax=Eubacteriales TaxID=186802 RepID=UPI001A9AACF1
TIEPRSTERYATWCGRGGSNLPYPILVGVKREEYNQRYRKIGNQGMAGVMRNEIQRFYKR